MPLEYLTIPHETDSTLHYHGIRWGTHGHIYYYDPEDKNSFFNAQTQAERQGRAIEASKVRAQRR